jgi:transposase
VEDWAEIRRLQRSEGLSGRAIATRMRLSRNTVAAALAADGPPKYSRAPAGSAVDAFESQIRQLLEEFPSMPATVIGERIGWTRSSSVLRAKVAALRPLYRGVDPADRTEYKAGELATGRNTAGACDDIGVLQVHHGGHDPIAHDWRPAGRNVVTTRGARRLASHLSLG